MDLISVLGVFLGAAGSLLLLSMRALPARWARLLADAGRERGRPAWTWAVMAAAVAGLVTIWAWHIARGGGASLAITILSTFLLARLVQALWVKKGLRELARAVMAGDVAVHLLPYTVACIALIVLGLL